MESLSILKTCTWLFLQVCAFNFISIAEGFRHFVRNHVPTTYKFYSSVFTILFCFVFLRVLHSPHAQH